MELSQNVLIDVLLNVIGYVAAGALWMVLYSAFTGKSRKSAPAATAERVPEPAPARGREREYSGQFVRLNSGADDGLIERNSIAAATRGEQAQRQRNRAEVMRLAREMLRSGTSTDHVRNLLPISEGELALLADKQRA